MDIKILKRLEKLNQLSLTKAQESTFLAFWEKQMTEMAPMNAIDTAATERMVHVMPLETVVREDIAKKLFSRDDLQKGAPETQDGYWQVPRLVE